MVRASARETQQYVTPCAAGRRRTADVAGSADGVALCAAGAPQRGALSQVQSAGPPMRQ